MAVFLRNISFHGILLDALFEPGNSDWQTVHDLVSNGISDGTVMPLSTTVFERDDIEAAFRFMALGKHVGKVLIKVKCLHLLGYCSIGKVLVMVEFSVISAMTFIFCMRIILNSQLTLIS